MPTPASTALRRSVGVLALAAGLSYLVIEAAAASRTAGYSYLGNYVSDLGQPRSPLDWWMNAAFRIQGLAFVVTGAVLIATVRPMRGALTFTVFACMYAAGSVIVGLVPSGVGGAAQQLHAGGAAAAIAGGNLALIVAGHIGLPDRSRSARAFGYGLGLAAGAALIGTDLPAGACERAAIYSIIAWQLASGARLLSRGRADDRRADGRAR